MTSLAQGAPGSELDTLRAVVDSTRLLVVTLDAQGMVQGVSRAFERATGFNRERWARPIWELAALPDERKLLRAAFGPLREHELPPTVLFHLVTTGGARVIDWDIRVIRDEQRAPIVVLAGIDQTERLAAEKQLRKAEVFQRLILERLPAVVWATDMELRFTFSAGGGLASLGLGTSQVAELGTSLFGYFHTKDPNHPVIAPHLRALAGEALAFETRWNQRLFQSRVEPLRDPHERIIGCIGLALDVTEQASAAEALKVSETRLHRLVESDVIGIIFWDADGKITDANNAFLELLGFSRDELLSGSLSWKAQTPAEYRERDASARAELEATGRCSPYEKEFITKSGQRVPALVGGAHFDHAEENGLREGVAFVLDLREQLRLRQSRDRLLIQEQRARIETELANARLLLLVAGSKRLSRSMRIDDALAALTDVVVPGLADWSYVVHRGWSDGPALVASAHGDPNKRDLLRRLHGYMPDPNAPEGPARVFRSGESALYSNITAQQLSPSGAQWPIVGTRDPDQLQLIREIGMRSLLCVPVPNRDRVDAVLMLVSATDPHRFDEHDVILAQDLAGRAAVSLENARLLAEAIEAVQVRDDFLAVAAHELRTPLTSLFLQIQVLERGLEQGRLESHAALRGVRAAEAQGRRLSRLVDRLLDVARLASNRMTVHTEEFDLVQVVRGVVAGLSPDLQRARCPVQVDAPEQAVGQWDRVRIEQVLTNLLANAMKFGEGHPIEVTVEAGPTQVQISVRDHGIGISSEDQARIFGRFERAVSVRHFGGLGLGLYITVQIVRAHGGSLRVESSPGRGALFIIDLPRTPEDSIASEEDEAETVTPALPPSAHPS